LILGRTRLNLLRKTSIRMAKHVSLLALVSVVSVFAGDTNRGLALREQERNFCRAVEIVISLDISRLPEATILLKNAPEIEESREWLAQIVQTIQMRLAYVAALQRDLARAETLAKRALPVEDPDADLRRGVSRASLLRSLRRVVADANKHAKTTKEQEERDSSPSPFLTLKNPGLGPSIKLHYKDDALLTFEGVVRVLSTPGKPAEEHTLPSAR